MRLQKIPTKKSGTSVTDRSLLISPDEIAQRLQALAKEIAVVYKKKQLLLVGVLNGGLFVTADLARYLHRAGLHTIQLDTVAIESYGDALHSSGNPKLVKDLKIDPKGKNVLIVDDIVDTGLSLQFLHHMVEERGAASVRSFVMFSKSQKRSISYEPTYVGFTIPDIWVEGYGMDTRDIGRANPALIIRVIKNAAL